jgi:transposase
MRQKS